MSRARPLLRRPARLGLAVLAVLALAAPAKADAVVADLSSHLVAITTGFTGESVVLFGATDGPGDVVAVVRGPDSEVTVWRKSKIAGVFVNTESMIFGGVPKYYAISSSRPLNEIVVPAVASLYRIGVGSLKFEPRDPIAPDRVALFSESLIGAQQRAGLFATSVGKITFLGERLFRATLNFPANVPTGTYLVEIFLVRDRDVVSGQTTPLVVSKVGIDAAVFDFASTNAALYGLIAVLTAMVAGWLSSLPFRSR